MPQALLFHHIFNLVPNSLSDALRRALPERPPLEAGNHSAAAPAPPANPLRLCIIDDVHLMGLCSALAACDPAVRRECGVNGLTFSEEKEAFWCPRADLLLDDELPARVREAKKSTLLSRCDAKKSTLLSR